MDENRTAQKRPARRGSLDSDRRIGSSSGGGSQMNAPLSLSEQAAIEYRRDRAASESMRQPAPKPQSQSREAESPTYIPAYKRGLKALNGAELLKAEFPPRSLMLAPWLPEKGLAM